MAYPSLPFENHTWRISHHQGILTPRVLNALLFAASTYQESRDPTHEINNYLVTNGIVPPNVRGDSQQADVWRDYQQLLPELGLIPSTRNTPKIELSPAGLSFLDRGIGFTDLVTIQAFRWQYPNGHNTQRSAGDPSGYNFAAQQAANGILIKPAVLLWQVLDALTTPLSLGRLSASEIERFLIPARAHSEVPEVIEAIKHNRQMRLVAPSGQTKQKRNASDWIKRLGQTHAFKIDAEDFLTLSAFSASNLMLLRELMERLTSPKAFWRYPSDRSQALSWTLWYGTFDTETYPIPSDGAGKDYGSAPEPEDEGAWTARTIQPRPFNLHVNGYSAARFNSTISSLYSAELSNSAHRLHDSMVRLIAETCRRKQAKAYFDPATLDILIELDQQELLVEVKSATSQNLAQKLRLALGQVTYYGYLRSRQNSKIKRSGIAVTLGIEDNHWSKDFLNNYLDVDLITLRNGKLLTYSRSRQVSELLSQ